MDFPAGERSVCRDGQHRRLGGVTPGKRGIVLRRGMMRRQLLLWFLPVMLRALQTFAEVSGSPSPDLVFIYVHGIGGEKSAPQFCVNMREFLAETKAPARVENYLWDSAKIDILRAGAKTTPFPARIPTRESGYILTTRNWLVAEDGTRRRIARGHNLHAILASLNVDARTGLHKSE